MVFKEITILLATSSVSYIYFIITRGDEHTVRQYYWPIDQGPVSQYKYIYEYNYILLYRL